MNALGDPLRLDRQLCFPLYAASNLLTRIYRPLLTQLGLTYPQYLVMLVLWETDGINVGALGERLHLDSGTLTPLLKRMEQAGLVKRQRDPSDERRVLVQLTGDGLAMHKRARRLPEIAGGTLGLSPDGMRQLRETMQTLVATMAAAGPLSPLELELELEEA